MRRRQDFFVTRMHRRQILWKEMRRRHHFLDRILMGTLSCWSEDCFFIAHSRNNVAFLFGTLKVQSFMLTEVRDCDLLIVVTSSTFLKRKDMLKEKRS